MRLSEEQRKNQKVKGLREGGRKEGREAERKRKRERETNRRMLVTHWTCEVREEEELRVKLG